jgi:hypothetical protein
VRHALFPGGTYVVVCSSPMPGSMFESNTLKGIAQDFTIA